MGWSIVQLLGFGGFGRYTDFRVLEFRAWAFWLRVAGSGFRV